jgi:hypothetical protein
MLWLILDFLFIPMWYDMASTSCSTSCSIFDLLWDMLHCVSMGFHPFTKLLDDWEPKDKIGRFFVKKIKYLTFKDEKEIRLCCNFSIIWGDAWKVLHKTSFNCNGLAVHSTSFHWWEPLLLDFLLTPMRYELLLHILYHHCTPFHFLLNLRGI